MARFLIRIEIHNGIWPDDYNKLHAAMKLQGFARIIHGADGKDYYLPTAEYLKEWNYTISLVIHDAEIAAKTIGKKYGIVAGECTNILINGLQAV